MLSYAHERVYVRVDVENKEIKSKRKLDFHVIFFDN